MHQDKKSFISDKVLNFLTRLKQSIFRSVPISYYLILIHTVISEKNSITVFHLSANSLVKLHFCRFSCKPFPIKIILTYLTFQYEFSLDLINWVAKKIYFPSCILTLFYKECFSRPIFMWWVLYALFFSLKISNLQYSSFVINEVKKSQIK